MRAHVQEDLIYLGQRDGNLYLDAGRLAILTDWSLNFDLGMEFLDFHHPVPKVFAKSGLAGGSQFYYENGSRAAMTGFNWTLTVEPILDTSPETFEQWGVKKEKRFI